MNKPYIKLIEQKERESKSYFGRARDMVKAFAKNIPFPLEEQIQEYRNRKNNRLDAVLEYLTDTYIAQLQTKIKPPKNDE